MQNSSIVEMKSYGAVKQAAQAKALIDQSHQIAKKYLAELLKRMLDNADDILFELADKATSNTDQNTYFDAMRELRMVRQSLEGEFRTQFELSHSLFLNPVAQPQVSPQENDDYLDFEDINLVDDSLLEESVAISAMVAKVKSRLPRDIYALEQRFNAIVSAREIEIDSLPFGPKELCRCFKEATKVFDVDTKLRLIVYKLFDKYVLNNIAPLYEELNALLIQAGVLPKLRMSLKKLTNPKTRVIVAEEEGDWLDKESVSPTQQSLDEGAGYGSSKSESTLFTTLNQLLSVIDTPNPAPNINGIAGGAGGEENNGNRQDLIKSLSNIQVDTSIHENIASILDLKAALDTQLEQLKESSNINTVDSDIIDIVGMLFDYILDDQTLPNSAKALLARLQIPMIKVAVEDKEFFRSKNHPARKLLNLMSKSVIGLSEESNSTNNPLIGEIERIVNKILSEFDSDSNIFVDLLADFEAILVVEESKQTEAKETCEARVKERESQALSNAWVTDVIANVLHGKELPKAVYELLVGPWKEVMIQTYLNEGEDSTAWKENLRFMDALTWSVEPKSVGTDKKRLGNIIQQLLDTLKTELKNIYFPPAKLDHLLAELETCHMAVLRVGRVDNSQAKIRIKSDSDTDTSETIAREIDDMQKALNGMVEADDLLKDFLSDINPDKANQAGGKSTTGGMDEDEIEEIILSSSNKEDKTIPEIDDVYWKAVTNLTTGQWISLTDSVGRTQRVKLAWKSDMLGECTFVNWKFKPVGDFSFNQLAAKFRKGSAHTLDELPLFEKALDSVVNVLSKKTI